MNRIYQVEEKALRNRSSKQLILIQGWKPAVRSASNQALADMASNGIKEAVREQHRRDKVRDKNLVRKDRYTQKLANKRAQKTA